MSNSNSILPIESIQERDVDLILLEEFYTDTSFCQWFINELDLPAFDSEIGVWRSISDFGLGETDLLFAYQSSLGSIAVLIENKLDASFQDEQYNRYLKRAVAYVESKKYDNSFVVLIAPELYCNNQNDFEYFITYEKIAERFGSIGSKRNLFKKELLQIATEKLRRGYQPVNSDIVQRFWLNYWKLKEEKFPTLKMKKPVIVPHNSDWPMMTDNHLPKVQFYHKFTQGNIDATFKGIPDREAEEIKSILPENIKLVKHAKSYSLRINTPKIYRTSEFNIQKNNLIKGLSQIDYLRNWIVESKILS